MDLMLDQFVPEKIAFIHAGNLYSSYDSIWESLRPLKDRIPLNRISFQMTEWYPVNEESYLAIRMSFDLENKNNRPCSCSIIEGMFYPVEKRICETDAFLRIKFEEDAIDAAIIDAIEKLDKFPLWNKTIPSNIQQLKDYQFPWYALDEDQQ